MTNETQHTGDEGTAVEHEAPPIDGESEPATITIGLWSGMAGMAAVGLVGGWLLVRFLGGGQGAAPPVGAPAASAPASAAVGPAESGTVMQGADGELVPGMVLEVADPTHPLANASAPDIAGALLDGTPARLSDYGAAPVLVNFWATWCPPCRLEMPWLEEAWQARRAQGLVVLAVNAGERVPPERVLDTVRRYVIGAGLTFPMLLPDHPDADQLRYQAISLPTSYLVRDGQVREVVAGAFPNRATLNARLDALLAGAER